MASFDKFLYNFAKYQKLDKMKLTGYSYAVGGGATVDVLLTNSVDKVLLASGTTVPGAVANYAKGAIFIKTDAGAATKALYENQGTTSAASFNLIGKITTSAEIDSSLIQVDSIALTPTDICTATTIKTLVAAPATGYFIEFISATLSYKYAGAGYGGGGNLTIGWVGGAALTGVLSAANSFGATSDKLYTFVPLATAAQAAVKETALGLQTAGTFTLGSATGTGLVTVAYRVLPIAS